MLMLVIIIHVNYNIRLFSVIINVKVNIHVTWYPGDTSSWTLVFPGITTVVLIILLEAQWSCYKSDWATGASREEDRFSSTS